MVCASRRISWLQISSSRSVCALLREETSAMRRPSGDHFAPEFRPGAVGARAWPLATDTIQTSRAIRFAARSGVDSV